MSDLLGNKSDVITQGLRIQVRGYYIAERSDHVRGIYFFAYHIRITNEGDAPCKLMTRHWIIRDATGRVDEVRGDGVIGEQPRLETGESHEYTSFCPLPTPRGSMKGTFHMLRDNGQAFDAEIGRFNLIAPEILN